MNHPDELLAEYVDGTLPAADRDAVRAHLTSCARCGEEVAAATVAAETLRRLPQPAIPAGLADAAEMEASRTRARPERSATPATWYRWAGLAAAAAAVVAIVALALPDIGGSNGGASSAAMGASRELSPPDAIEIQQTNYDSSAVLALARTYMREAAPQADAGMTAAAPRAVEAGVDQAVACVRSALTSETDPTLTVQGDPVRIIRARFEGIPAYLGVFLAGPGPDQQTDTVTVVVASTKGCSVLSSTQAQR
jgi:anti-sigma factor RsiW